MEHRPSAGAETGVAQVQFLEGAALWKAASDGLWSPDVAQAALSTDPPLPNVSARDLIRPPSQGEPFIHHAILVQYRDGLRSIVLGASPGVICLHPHGLEANNFISWTFSRRLPLPRSCATQTCVEVSANDISGTSIRNPCSAKVYVMIKPLTI